MLRTMQKQQRKDIRRSSRALSLITGPAAAAQHAKIIMRQLHQNMQLSFRIASHAVKMSPPTSSCTFESACRPRQHACFDALDKVTAQVESPTSSTRGCTSGGSSSLAMRSLPSGSFDRDVVLEPQRRQHANSWTKSATLHFLTVHATMCSLFGGRCCT